MPGPVPGMMLFGGLCHDPGVIVAIQVFHRQNHESRRGIGVEFFDGPAHALGHRSAGLDEHDDLLGPLDFAFPPVMRDHPRQNIDASGQPALDDRAPGPLRLDNRWPSRIDEHRAFHRQVPL